MDTGIKEFCPAVHEAEVREVSGWLEGAGGGAALSSPSVRKHVLNHRVVFTSVKTYVTERLRNTQQ